MSLLVKPLIKSAMKYLNYILSILVALLFFTEIVYAEPGGDLNLTNKANLSSRTGYDLILGTQSTSDTIDFIVGGTREGYVDSAGLNGFTLVSPTLSSPTISGNLTFSTAAAKIIPGVTSLTFRNNADSASNLIITDAGNITVRGTSLLTGNVSIGSSGTPAVLQGSTDGRFTVTGGAVSTGHINFELSHASALFRIYNSSASAMWTVNDSGTISQNSSSGGNIVLQKDGTGILGISGNTTTLNFAGGASAVVANGGFLSAAGVSAGVNPGDVYLESGSSSGGEVLIRANGTAGGNVFAIAKGSTGDFIVRTSNSETTRLTIDETGLSTFTGNIVPSAADTQTLGTQTVAFNPLFWGNGATYQGSLSYSGGNTSVVIGSLSNHELEFRANAGEVWEMNPDGTFVGSGTATIGWAVVDGSDNTACSSQCTTPAVFGFNLAAGATAPVLVGPSDATADICLCAGAS